MTRGSRGRLARAARAVVVDHLFRTVRGLGDRVAQGRVAEVLSDVWEHAAASDRAGRSSAALAAQLLSRMLRGVPADAAWRRARLRVRRVEVRTAAERRRGTGLPLTGVGPMFDQTNGSVGFDPGPQPEAEGEVADLIGKAPSATGST